MNVRIAGERIMHIGISRAKELLGIENKICGLTGVTGKPSPRTENRFGGSFCQSIVF